MDLNNLLKKLTDIDKAFKENNPEYEKDIDKAKLGRMVKLTEEVGELADEVLANQGLQRDDKMAAKQKGDLGDEFGDVFNSLMLLGIKLDLDLVAVISARVDAMHKRYTNRD